MTVVRPVYELFPEIVQVPAPFFVRPSVLDPLVMLPLAMPFPCALESDGPSGRTRGDRRNSAGES